MAKNKKMTNDELVAILDTYETDSVSYNSEFMNDNQDYLARYFCEKYGDEQEGFSQVVATDVRDIVEADMTSLIRVFLGSGEIMVFQPYDDTPEAIEEAKEKTKAINHIVQKRKDSYKINHDFIKDAEIQKMGVLHYYMDEWQDTKEKKYKDVDATELTIIIDDLEAGDKVEKVDVASKEELGGGRFNVSLRITENKKDVKISNIATENFLITRNATSVDESYMVGHVSYPTRSELVVGGMNEDEVAKFPTSSQSSGADFSQNNNTSSSGTAQSEAMTAIRFRDQGGNITDIDAFSEWANETVRMITMFALVDYDNDGISERRWIEKIGGKITKNIPYNHVPYAVGSAILEPHKAIGNGRASLVMEDQSVNTALDRALLDNTYESARPRHLVGDGVNLDDFLNHRDQGVVRMKQNSSLAPKDAAIPLNTTYIGNEILQVAQYRDQQQATRAGTVLDSQGLEADQLHQETATRFDGIERAREAKIELVARNIAETGYRKLYEGLVWTLTNYQDEEMRFPLDGGVCCVNPDAWGNDELAVSQVGLGAGAGDKIVQQMTGLYTLQNQLKMEGSQMVDESKIYNTINRMVEGLGLSGTHLYFNNPEQPQDLIQAQNEQLQQALMMAQQQIEQLSQGNPLAEAEMVKQQGAVARDQQKHQVDMLKTQENSRLKELELLQKGSQFQANLTKEYTDLELQNDVDIPNEGMEMSGRSTEDLIAILSQYNA